VSKEARDRILERLRSATVSEVPARPPSYRAHAKPWSQHDKAASFTAALTALHASPIRTTETEWPAVLRLLLKERGCRTLAYGPGSSIAYTLEREFARDVAIRLAPYDRDIDASKEDVFSTDAAITLACAGIADTGAILVCPTVEEPRLLSLAPDIHVAVLRAEDLYASFDEALRDQSWHEKMPTNLLLIAGPSKTADIEGILVFGAHGPREVVVLLIEPSQDD
jgi:L-lactate dehydrogenase complex protein LldG